MFTNDEIVILNTIILNEKKSLGRALEKLKDHEVVTKSVYRDRIEKLDACFSKLTKNFIKNTNTHIESQKADSKKP